MATAAREGAMYLLLGGSGAGKTLLVKRLQKLSSKDGAKELGEPPATLPTYMIDAARPTQISSSCVQLLSLLSAEKLASVPVLIIFNKIICSEEVCHCLFLGLRDCDVPKVIRRSRGPAQHGRTPPPSISSYFYNPSFCSDCLTANRKATTFFI
ncbi:ADP-ribosylation factor-like protein 16 isoform X7 [Anolis carolinensis]|uniref:ADP-ribosylation factor-like protein 16 isoform X7 n=1 Tax=Anolis carolinensis TaxID=28377 RepID=UPI002F2B8A69